MIVVRCLVLYSNFAKSRLSGGKEEMEGQEGQGRGEKGRKKRGMEGR